jgi:hypothetical protein
MSSSSRSIRQLLLALGAGSALAVGIVACGDSDDGAGSSPTASGGSDRQQARAAVEQLYTAMNDGDAEGVCAQLSKAAQKQIAAGGLGKKADSCSGSFQKFLDQADAAGGLDLVKQAKVKQVKVTGRKAVAKVSFRDRASGDVPLVKEDGEWKLEAVGAGG